MSIINDNIVKKANSTALLAASGINFGLGMGLSYGHLKGVNKIKEHLQKRYDEKQKNKLLNKEANAMLLPVAAAGLGHVAGHYLYIKPDKKKHLNNKNVIEGVNKVSSYNSLVGKVPKELKDTLAVGAIFGTAGATAGLMNEGAKTLVRKAFNDKKKTNKNT